MTLFWAATLIAIIVAPRRACAIRVPLRPSASEGEGTYVFCANCSRNPNIRMRMHDSKPVRLLITLNGTRHRPVHDAHAPATRLRRPARVHKLTIAAGSDSSSTFVRRDGGVAAPDARMVLKCHPESVRLRRPPAAKRLATGSAQSPAWRPSCRVSSRPSPRPTTGAVSDELTASAC